MHSNTLQGIFPDPKPAHRKNFIRENVRFIKQMQGIVQPDNEPRFTRETKYMQVPSKVMSNSNTPMHRNGPTHIKETASIPNSKMQKSSKKSLEINKQQAMSQKDRLQIKQMRDFGQVPRRTEDENPGKFTDRSVQTEKSTDIKKIYEQGKIKFPSMSLVNNLNNSRPKRSRSIERHQDRGDSPLRSLSPDKADLSVRLQNLEIEDKNFIRENRKAVRNKTIRSEQSFDPNRAPPNYQKGVLPKYLKERKEDAVKPVEDPDCPPGHVLLPDEERKETLRVLRQSYADRIQELNSMPVRNDTLKMRRRKMDLEEELKKIDEGIKVFQRPKVFVKINA